MNNHPSLVAHVSTLQMAGVVRMSAASLMSWRDLLKPVRQEAAADSCPLAAARARRYG